MTLHTLPDTTPADDGFEAFYAEKIWALVPGLYRDEDARSRTPGALRALVEVLAGQAAAERRSIERLRADAQVTDCDDWALPYIGALLATRLVSELNGAGRRNDVLNTIRYRRLGGTLRLLPLLADDIAGWDAAASEGWKRLFRLPHGLDCPAPEGPSTGSPQHGLPRIGRGRPAELAGTAWDEFARFPDVRRLRGEKGRYGIAKVNLHIYRQFAFRVLRGTPHRLDDRHYTADPSGRDIALFRPGRPLTGGCRQGAEWELRGPISCGLINEAGYRPGPEAAAASIGAGLLAVAGETFHGAAALVARAEHINGAPLTAAEGRGLLEHALLEASARAQLLPDALALAIGTDPEDTLPRPDLMGGDLSAWESLDPAPWPWVRAVVDPARGRIWLAEAPGAEAALHLTRHHYGLFAPLGAGTHERGAGLAREGLTPLPDPAPADNDPGPVPGLRLPGAPGPGAPAGQGAYQVNDSRTHVHLAAPGLTLTGDLTLQAANGERPYLRLPLEPGTSRWEIEGQGGALTLDGLWLGLFPDGHGPVADPAPPVGCALVLSGSFDTVTLRHMTLDPGGARARIAPGLTEVIPAVTLLVEGAVGRLVIESSILGPLEESLLAGSPCAAREICISDSVLVGGADGVAIRTRYAALSLARSTVLGAVSAARLMVEDSIVQGTLGAQDAQGSCVRYSAAVETATAGIPNAYRCLAFPGAMPDHLFVSRRFGDAGFAQLSATAPEALRRGAESTSEMGVFHDAIDAVKRDDLIRKLAEFSPVSVIPQLIFET
ncbi:hypothetical protein [Oceanicella sp. SM1341]|uniref:hypothetical protein n=1 Tax=Oceanicella sp. SM1341 TaxID=1548889 RepID=UPI000E4A1C33|nr:hypothetical protein [Oceanicella sp. SM1341]